jgi:hypothetical protein
LELGSSSTVNFPFIASRKKRKQQETVQNGQINKTSHKRVNMHFSARGHKGEKTFASLYDAAHKYSGQKSIFSLACSHMQEK